MHKDERQARENLRYIAATYALPIVYQTAFEIADYWITELHFGPRNYVGAVELTDDGTILHHVAMDATATMNPKPA